MKKLIVLLVLSAASVASAYAPAKPQGAVLRISVTPNALLGPSKEKKNFHQECIINPSTTGISKTSIDGHPVVAAIVKCPADGKVVKRGHLINVAIMGFQTRIEAINYVNMTRSLKGGHLICKWGGAFGVDANGNGSLTCPKLYFDRR
jgi:hypothetical protein